VVPVDQREVAQVVERLAYAPGVLLAAHPDRRVDAAQVVGHRVLAQGLVAELVGVLVEVRDRQLAQRAVHRVAPAQADAVGLGDRAPAAAPAEEGHHVVEVAHRAHVHQQRRLAVHPQRAGGEHRALDAVRLAGAQHCADRPAGIAVGLEVLPQLVQESLDLLRRVEAFQDGELRRREPQVLRAREASSRHGRQKYTES
jgi:hypothetical protein